jgi:hypothetical protein
MPTEIDVITIKVKLDDSLVNRQLEKIRKQASSIIVTPKFNSNLINNQINGIQNRLNRLVINPITGNINKDIANQIKSGAGGNLIGNALGEVIGAGIVGKTIGDSISKQLGDSKGIGKIEEGNKKIEEAKDKFIKVFSDKNIDIAEKFRTSVETNELMNQGVLQKTNEQINILNKELQKRQKIIDKQILDSSISGKDITKNKALIKAKQELVNIEQKLIELDKERIRANRDIDAMEKYKIGLKRLDDAKYRKQYPIRSRLSSIRETIRSKMPVETPDVIDKKRKSSGYGIFGRTGGNILKITMVTYGIREAIRLIDEASKKAEIFAKLNGVLASTGNTTGYTSAQLNKMSESISQLTNYTDEQITSAQTLMATYSNVKGDIFKGAIQGATDLSSVFGVDVVQASKLLGRMLNDPLANLNALKKAGISFSDEQKKQIELAINANDVFKAQKIILDEVSSKVGGAAINNANLITQIGNSFGEMKDRVGEFLIALGMVNGDFENIKNNNNAIISGFDSWKVSQSFVDTLATIRLTLASIVDLTQMATYAFISMMPNLTFAEKIEQIDLMKKQFKDMVDNWAKWEEAKDKGPNSIPKLIKDTKVAPKDKSEDKLTTTLDKANKKAKELKDRMKDAFNIGDITSWWDTFLQSTVEFNNKQIEARIKEEEFNNEWKVDLDSLPKDGTFKNPNNLAKPILEEGFEDTVDAIDESNVWLSKISRNVGVFA